MGKFVVARRETIDYHIDYDRAQVEEMLIARGPYAIDELRDMSDTALAKAFQEELKDTGPVTDYVIEQSERYGDVQGSTLSVAWKP